MLFNSYTIFIYIALIVVVYNASRWIFKKRLVNNVIILLANLLLLTTFVKEHSLIVLSVLSLFVFGLGRLLQKKNWSWATGISIGFIVALFAIRNYEVVQTILEHSWLDFINGPVLSVQKVGISYILFRQVHWLVESHRKSIHQSDALSFLNYIFFFPSFLAGPIDQYNNFHYWLGNTRMRYDRSLLLAGVTRIFLGAVKTFGIVPLLIEYATNYQTLLPDFAPWQAVLLSALCYSFYIYFDFSGYSDIAIGTAYLLGIKTPENFNNPYISANLSEFWKRWHITFSLFLRWYVFKPFIQLFNLLLTTRYRMPVTVLAYLATFAVCGLWHGSTINFLYWGLWHGAGLAINKIWTTNTRHRSWVSTRVYKLTSIGITFSYVTIGWLFFHYKTDQLAEIFTLLFQ